MKKNKEESVESVNKEIDFDRYKTDLSKNAFAVEILNGLGAEIKKNPNKVVFLNEKLKEEESKLPIWIRFRIKIRKFFNKF